MNDIATLIDSHLAAYCEPDRKRRSEAVDRIWAPGGALLDPPLAAHGRQQIVEQVDAVLGQFPGHRFRRSSDIDAHHGAARYEWQLVDGSGQVRLGGCDFAEIDEDGRLTRVTGFFGPLSPLVQP